MYENEATQMHLRCFQSHYSKVNCKHKAKPSQHNTKEINPTKKHRDLMARESSKERAYSSECKYFYFSKTSSVFIGITIKIASLDSTTTIKYEKRSEFDTVAS